jgi:hypothetical protein
MLKGLQCIKDAGKDRGKLKEKESVKQKSAHNLPEQGQREGVFCVNQ